MGTETDERVDPATSRGGEPAGGVNEVHLIGRLSVDPEVRTLPSGDEVVLLRLVVPRPPVRVARAAGRRPPTVDTLELACWSAGSRRSAARLAAGATVEAWGALRRRFFRSGGGPQSRYEVEVHRIKRARG